MIIVVGAGLAGLTCAKLLRAAGREVLVLEAADQVGGRVRTDRRDGFLLDRGFQVLFTAYPAARRQLDLAALDLKLFQPGAAIARGGKLYTVADPFRDRNPGHLVETVTNPLISVADKLRVASLRADLRRRGVGEIFQSPDIGERSTLDELLARGFAAEGFIDQFIRPFYGGIFLNRDLHTSARMFLFTFKMLAEGETAVPAGGIGAITEQLAGHLAPGSLRLKTTVVAVRRAEGRAVGVQLADGTTLAAEAVVIATAAPAAGELAGITIPAAARPLPVTCVYFQSPVSCYSGPKIVLNANPDAVVNNVTQITNVAPSYAPAGDHLLSAVVLGQPEDEDALIRACRTDLARIFPAAPVAAMRHVGTYRVAMAQFDQPPGIYRDLPGNTTATPGLYVAGEFTESSSIHGAMHSGEKAAAAILAGEGR